MTTPTPTPGSSTPPVKLALPLPGPIAAFDVGGTDLKAGLVFPDGSITHESSTPTPRDRTDPAGAVIARVVELAREMDAAVGAGVVVPGIVDAARGVGVLSANLGWRDAPFREPLRAQLGVPVGFDHDVTAAAIAEATFGSAQDTANAAVVIIGTGIAAGVFIDGKPHRAGGYAGELGHTVIDPSGPACPCGARGCLEQFASAAAIARRYTELSGTPAAGAREVLAAKHSGDAHAQAAWAEAIEALAAGLRQLAAILSPDVVVIGGGLLGAGDDLLVPLRAAATRTFTVHPVPEIRPATSGPNAGLLGSAIIGAQAVHS